MPAHALSPVCPRTHLTSAALDGAASLARLWPTAPLRCSKRLSTPPTPPAREAERHGSFSTILAAACPRRPIPFVGRASAGTTHAIGRSSHESLPVVHLRRGADGPQVARDGRGDAGVSGPR